MDRIKSEDAASAFWNPGNPVHPVSSPSSSRHLQPVLPQPLRDRAHHRLVLRAIAEEDVVGEYYIAHTPVIKTGFTGWTG